MNDMSRETSLNTDEAVEALLGKAAPRPVPPAAEARAVREAVQAEWRQVSGRHKRRKSFVRMAMAASVLVAVFISLNALRINGIEEVQVASIDKRFGMISVLGENSEMLEGSHLTTIVAGQTLITDDDSGMSLNWGGGGSLRLDENTRVEFLSDEQVFLSVGRIYFDSTPAFAAGLISDSDARLTIVTDFGEITHVGTQYMTRANRDAVTVSVREGEVVIEGAGISGSASQGQQLAISGSGVRSMGNIPPYGSAWEWIEQTTPPVNLDGRSVSDFLGWVSRETGFGLEYESNSAEAYARQELLRGAVKTDPRQALQFWMLGTDLGWRIENGVIYVNEAR
jgi:ferric-dicitrate binding protein FerR (iron transport regulator)